MGPLLVAALEIAAYTRSRGAPAVVMEAAATLRASALRGELAMPPADPLDLVVRAADHCHEKGIGWEEINARMAAANLMNPDRRI